MDGSYEGDLIAMAGISTAWGREGVAQYNESLAGRLFVPNKVGGHQFGVPLDYTYPNGTLLPMIYTGDPGQVRTACSRPTANADWDSRASFAIDMCADTLVAGWPSGRQGPGVQLPHVPLLLPGQPHPIRKA